MEARVAHYLELFTSQQIDRVKRWKYDRVHVRGNNVSVIQTLDCQGDT